MPTDPIALFTECINGNPYIFVRVINEHRMTLGFLNLEGLAMLCRASQSANIAGGIGLTRRSAKKTPMQFEDFTAVLQSFRPVSQLIYLIDICWSLRALCWNLDAVNACEAALQAAYIAFPQDEEGLDEQAK